MPQNKRTNGWKDSKTHKFINNQEETLPYQASIMQLLNGANKSKITRVCREMRPNFDATETQAKGLSPKRWRFPDSYCCQGYQYGPRSPQFLSSNCDKVRKRCILNNLQATSGRNISQCCANWIETGKRKDTRKHYMQKARHVNSFCMLRCLSVAPFYC